MLCRITLVQNSLAVKVTCIKFTNSCQKNWQSRIALFCFVVPNSVFLNHFKSKLLTLLMTVTKTGVRCKLLLHENIWLPFVDKLVDQVCKDCKQCLAVSPTETPDLIKPSPLPKKQRRQVSIDLYGPFPSDH